MVEWKEKPHSTILWRCCATQCGAAPGFKVGPLGYRSEVCAIQSRLRRISSRYDGRCNRGSEVGNPPPSVVHKRGRCAIPEPAERLLWLSHRTLKFAYRPRGGRLSSKQKRPQRSSRAGLKVTLVKFSMDRAMANPSDKGGNCRDELCRRRHPAQHLLQRPCPVGIIYCAHEAAQPRIIVAVINRALDLVIGCENWLMPAIDRIKLERPHYDTAVPVQGPATPSRHLSSQISKEKPHEQFGEKLRLADHRHDVCLTAANNAAITSAARLAVR